MGTSRPRSPGTPTTAGSIPFPTGASAVQAMIRAWAVDTADGRDTLLVAYRRDNVDTLNAAARAAFERVGLLTGPELTAPGGRSYRAGDRIITLAPGPRGAWVTSQPAVVTAVDPDTAMVNAQTPDGRTLHLGPDDIGGDRLAHGYAITAHRAQGTTVDAAHVLNDGGGRELAYVAMSRARQSSHMYVTAGDLRDAVERLAWGWDDQRRQQWVTDQARAAQAIADMRTERDQLRAAIPPDVTHQLTRLRDQQAAAQRDLADLHAGTGRWAHTPGRSAYLELVQARRAHNDALRRAEDPHQGMLGRRRNRQAVETSAAKLRTAEAAWKQAAEPHDQQLAALQADLAWQGEELDSAQQARADYLEANPQVVGRVRELEKTLDIHDAMDWHQRRRVIPDLPRRARLDQAHPPGGPRADQGPDPISLAGPGL